MPTSNELYQTAALIHAIDVRRFTQKELQQLLEIAQQSDQQLVKKLRKELSKFVNRPFNPQSQRFKKLIELIDKERLNLWKILRSKIRSDFKRLVEIEVEMEERLLRDSIPIEIELTQPKAQDLAAILVLLPFASGNSGARTFSQWLNTVIRRDKDDILSAIQLGLTQNETVNQLIRRLAGTRKNKFSDGSLSKTRRNLETLVNTFSNHVSNSASEEVWKANSDIIAGLVWTATLDGRTSAVCRGRDGAVAPIGDKPIPEGRRKLDPPTARPPAHPSCRSIMVPIIDGAGLVGERPFVRSKDSLKTVDFEALAKREGITVKQAKQRWIEKNVGRVPAETTYNDWLKKQPNSFQDEVLGKTKAKLFRKGDLTLDKFINRNGRELTLDELAKTNPTAFTKADLDPKDFVD